MPTVKDRLYVGNTYSVAFDCFEPPTPTNTSGQYASKTAKAPSSAIAELWSVQDQDFVQLGDVLQHAACEVEGNTVAYTVPADKLTVAGDYKLFVTITFPDGQVVTESRVFKVQARS